MSGPFDGYCFGAAGAGAGADNSVSVGRAGCETSNWLHAAPRIESSASADRQVFRFIANPGVEKDCGARNADRISGERGYVVKLNRMWLPPRRKLDALRSANPHEVDKAPRQREQHDERGADEGDEQRG